MGSLIPAPDWFNAVFSVFFLVWVGDRLEEVWGAFRLTLYCFDRRHRHNRRRIFLRREIFEWNVDLVSVLCFRAFLSRCRDLLRLHFAAQSKVDRVDLRRDFAVAFVFASMAFRSALLVAFANYLIFFGPRHHSRGATSPRRFNAATALRHADAQCDRGTSASLCGLRRDGSKRSESRFSCRIRRRGILHVAPAERRQARPSLTSLRMTQRTTTHLFPRKAGIACIFFIESSSGNGSCSVAEEQRTAKVSLSSLVQEVRALGSTQLLTMSMVTPKADSVSC